MQASCKITGRNIGVAIITSLFYPYYGGAEKQLERLSFGLSSRGVECYVLTRRLNYLKPFELLHNVPVYRVFATCLRSGWLSTLTFVMSGCLFFITHPKITRGVQILQADCDSPGLIAVIVGKLFKKKVVIRMRGTRQIYGIKASLFGKIIFKTLSAVSDAIITQYNQNYDLETLGIVLHKIQIIPNGVDTEYFKKFDLETKKALQEKIGCKNAIVGLYVGRLDPIKGVDVLINILPSVIKQHPNFKLIIVGSGSYEHYLKNLTNTLHLNEHVTFIGATQNVKLYYGLADAFFLPSKSEGTSNSLLEAMSMSLPVVVSDRGGSVDVIDDENNGLLINPFPSSFLLEKIQRLLGDPDLRRKLGMNARKTIESKFSIDKIVTRYICLYSSIIKSTAKR